MNSLTPFQALIILVKKYRNSPVHSQDEARYQVIKSLFLTGVESKAQFNTLQDLLSDPALAGKNIMLVEDDDLEILKSTYEDLTTLEQAKYDAAIEKLEAINNDPTRRYFESILGHETLLNHIDKLDGALLSQQFNCVFYQMPISMLAIVPMTIYMANFASIAASRSSTAPEYMTAIKKLKNIDNFPSFLSKDDNIELEERRTILQKRIDKMMLLTKTAHAAMTAVHRHNDEHFPINIYGEANSIFSTERRGRTARVDAQGKPQKIKANSLGIMRGKMPLARDSELFEDPSMDIANQYGRCPENSTYMPECEMPQYIFSTQVTPFVNSISGTMLCQLRVMAKLMADDELVYQDKPEELENYFRCFIAFMIYNFGGHTLKEFHLVIQLPQVQNIFKDLPGFERLNLKNLFQNTNQTAFDSALNKTIDYADMIFTKQALNKALMDSAMVGDIKDNDAKEHLKPKVKYKSFQKRLDKALDCILDPTIPSVVLGESVNILMMKINQMIRLSHDDTAKELAGDQTTHDIIINCIRQRYNLQEQQSAMTEHSQRVHILVNNLLNEIEIDKRRRFYQVSKSQPNLTDLIDHAYQVYKDTKSHYLDKIIAQEFLIYSLDIQHPEKKLNLKIKTAMNLRASLKESYPDFIPGRSPIPIDILNPVSRKNISKTTAFKKTSNSELQSLFEQSEILDVVTKAKIKDQGGRRKKKKKTVFYNYLERDAFRVDIHNGLFHQLGSRVSTQHSVSHGKKGFAAFTLDINGELSVFPHVNHDATGIAHSSLTGGKPVFCAGEIKIDDGKLQALTTYSGHYRPTLYNMYKLLSYFENRGVDVTHVKLYSLNRDPSVVGIVAKKSEEDPNFYECQAQDLLYAFKAKLRRELHEVRADLKKYQQSRQSWWHQWFHHRELTSRKLDISNVLFEYLSAHEQELNESTTLAQYKSLLDILQQKVSILSDRNRDESLHFQRSVGLLGNTISGFFEKINGSLQELEEFKKDNSSQLDSDLSSYQRNEALKQIGRRQR